MEREARSREDLLKLAEQTHDISLVAWRPPVGWIAPAWLLPEPNAARLPMNGARLKWCVHVLGWSIAELVRRVHSHDSSVRQWGRDKRDIPDVLAIWLEARAATMLAAPTVAQLKGQDIAVEDVAWKRPDDWEPPPWFRRTRTLPGVLPMPRRRRDWCLYILGWHYEIMGDRCANMHPTALEFAVWLELLTATMLREPGQPIGWRPRRQPETDSDMVERA